jgi:FkbM family methyltransferase
LEAGGPEPQPFGSFAPQGIVRRVLDRTRAAGPGYLQTRLAFLLRRIAIQNLAGRPVDIEALGAKMRLYPYNNVCEKRILFTPQFFDPEERALIKARLRPGFQFIDVGANIGGYALFVAAEAGPDARILAVEPQPDIYARLIYNIRLNPFFSVKAIQCAVADKDGELTLFIDRENKGESSVKVMSRDRQGQSVQVAARTLFGLVTDEGFTRIDAIKLDTEGAEDLILEPFFHQAPEALWPGLMVLERGGTRWHVDLAALLAARGYRVLAETRNNTIFARA